MLSVLLETVPMERKGSSVPQRRTTEVGAGGNESSELTDPLLGPNDTASETVAGSRHTIRNSSVEPHSKTGAEIGNSQSSAQSAARSILARSWNGGSPHSNFVVHQNDPAMGAGREPPAITGSSNVH